MNQKLTKGGHTSHLPLHTSNRGITLIALVITIIVLLILAGVTINMVLGEDGIIQNAQKAKNLNKDGQIEEALDLLRAEVKMAEHGLEPENLLPTKAEEVITRLKDKGLVEPGELEKKGLQTIGYTDETKTKTFSLEGIVKWDNSQAGDFIISDDGIITSYTGEGVTNVIIPEEIDGITVKRIEGTPGDEITDTLSVFGESSWVIEEIIIPDTVECIGYGAFAFVPIKSIAIPESVTTIEEDAFKWCSDLKDIILPNSITYIGDGAFVGTGLTSMTVPSSVTYLGNYAFYDCSYLENVEIPESVAYIGKGAFSDCYNLSSVDLPEGLSSIEEETFNNCFSLMNITIPSSVTSIGDGAFIYCQSLESITIEGTITELGEGVFEEVPEGCKILYQGKEYSPAEFETHING